MLELLPDRLVDTATLAAIALEVTARPCRTSDVLFTLRHPRGIEALGSMEDVPLGRRPAALALVIVERLRRLREPKVLVPVPPPRSPPERSLARAHAEITVHTSAAGVWLLGLGAGATFVPLGEWLPLRIDLGAGVGRRGDLLGVVDTTRVGLRLGPDLAWAGRWSVSIGPRLELGWVGVRGHGDDAAAEGNGSALYLLAGGELRVGRRFGEALTVELRWELGGALRGLVAEADGRARGGVDGWLTGFGLGVRSW